MAFELKFAECKSCGKKHLVPGGKYSGVGYEDCPKCRGDKHVEEGSQ